MSDAFDHIVDANQAFAASFPGPPSARPRRGLAVVACMDARIDVPAILGLQPGDAHVLRNAGGIITEDVVRSLCLSQRLLGTGAIALIHHTRCGLHELSDDEFIQELSADTGQTVPWRPGGFGDVDESVRASMRILRESPFLPYRGDIAGFVYETDSGRLKPVDLE